jgi:hypothetical protein
LGQKGEALTPPARPRRAARKARVNNLPFPQSVLVGLFAKTVHEAFGGQAYLVGSCVTTKDYRDVDVRLLLADVEFDEQFPPEGARPQSMNLKQAAMGAAFSYYGRHLTGLPIDFQIQKQSEANERHKGPRIPLGLEHGVWEPPRGKRAKRKGEK